VKLTSEEREMHKHFGEKMFWKKTTGDTKRKWDESIKMDLNKNIL
jgi:hypothetical protein